VKLYISPDLGTGMSGNTISVHELEALQSLEDSVIRIGKDQINPVKFGLPNNSFLQDYLAMDIVSRMELNGGKDNFAHLYAGPFGNTIRYLNAKGIKTVLSMDAHNRKDSIKAFEDLGYTYPYEHVKDDYLWGMYNAGPHEADVVIVPSMVSAEFLKQEGVDNRKLRIIPHGTVIPDEDKIKGVNTDNFNVGYIGQYGPDKGVRYLIETWSQLNYQDSTLIFGGTDSKLMGPFINKYAKTGKFNLMGYVNDVADFYNNVSVYIQPSVTEAWGMEVIEAMSYGRPVICSRGAGAVDAVDDGVNGFVVDKRDVKGIADKIDWFKNHPKELIEMGTAARKTSLNYDWSIIKQRYIDIWKEMM
jgi:glycosyltransferase involved in cell wall biosynthesis